MMYPCDHITERLATGEPLTAEQQAHVVGCVDCARLAHVPSLLAAAARETTKRRMGPGFSARMTVGARGRLAARRRNRVVAGALAAACAVTVAGVALTRPDHRGTQPDATHTLSEQEPQPRPPPVAERPATSSEEVVLELVRLSDVDRTIQGTAPWTEITAPLVPYRALLSQQGARKGAHR